MALLRVSQLHRLSPRCSPNHDTPPAMSLWLHRPPGRTKPSHDDSLPSVTASARTWTEGARLERGGPVVANVLKRGGSGRHGRLPVRKRTAGHGAGRLSL